MNTTTTIWDSRTILVGLYTISCFSLGLFGNVFALVASHAYKAIDLDSVSIIFVRNLAIADLMLVINTIFPTMVSIFAKKWVFGEILCDVSGHFNFLPVMVNIYLVLFLSLFKVYVCINPFKAKDIEPKHAWGFVFISYLLSSIEFLEAIFLSKKGIWMPMVDRCLSMIYMTHPTLMMWNAYIPVGIPLLIILAVNSWMFFIAKKYARQKGRANNQALMTVCSVSGIFVISWAPKLIYVTVSTITKSRVVWATALSHYFPFINSVCNPIVYTVTNRRYKAFVKSFFKKIMFMEIKDITTIGSPKSSSFSNAAVQSNCNVQQRCGVQEGEDLDKIFIRQNKYACEIESGLSDPGSSKWSRSDNLSSSAQIVG